MHTYALFWTDSTEEWPTTAFYGLWNGDTPEEAIERSQIEVGRPRATSVAALLWSPVMFGRTRFERTLSGGDDE